MNPFSILALLSVVADLYLGIYVLRLDVRARTNRVFFLMCLTLAIWSLGNGFIYSAHDKAEIWHWHRITAFGWALVGGIYLHFVISMVKPWLLKQWWIYPVLYVPGILCVYKVYQDYFTVIDFARGPYGWYEIGAPLDIGFILFILYFSSYVLIGSYMIWQASQKAATNRERLQYRILTIAPILALTTGIIPAVIMPARHVPIPNMDSSIVMIWVFGVWYAIARYRLLTLTPAIATSEIIGRIKEIMILTDPQAKIIMTNKYTEGVLGYSKEELIGISAFSLFEDQDMAQAGYNHMLAGMDGIADLICVAKNGERLTFRFTGSAIWDKLNDLVGIVIVGQNQRPIMRIKEEIMEKEKAQASLQESYAKLEELNQMKTDFLSTVSHELRTPLTSILGFTSIIRNKLEGSIIPGIDPADKKRCKDASVIQHDLGIIISESHRLTSLINDVLDISKMESGSLELNMQIHYIADIVNRAITATAGLFTQRNTALVTDIEPDLPPIMGDHDRLIQVLINLISNAVKFTPNGTVTCRAQLEDDQIIVSVSDTGIGIAAADLEVIFEKFKQVGDTLTDKPQGTGLGLPICQQIITMHNGHIWAESAPGNGATFFFSLPVETPQELGV
ncbi:MAG: ATP-binding protein [Acidobacteriota bacterium]